MGVGGGCVAAVLYWMGVYLSMLSVTTGYGRRRPARGCLRGLRVPFDDFLDDVLQLIVAVRASSSEGEVGGRAKGHTGGWGWSGERRFLRQNELRLEFTILSES